METDVQKSESNHVCGYCQTHLERKEPRRLTLQQVHEIETRISQGWRLQGDLLHLIHDVKHYLAQQSH